MYTKLVLSGGGHHGLTTLGVLDYFHKDLESVTDYYGTSIGSVLCFFLICGLKPFDIFQYVFQAENLSNYISLEPSLNGLGLCTMTNFLKLVSECNEQTQTYSQMTFQQLFDQTQKTLNIIGTNVDQMKGVVFNHSTNPNMNVLLAIEISCSIPFVFERKMYGGESYIDGGIANNYPIDIAITASTEKDLILGICLLTNVYNLSLNQTLNWLIKLLFIPSRELYHLRIANLPKNVVHLEIPVWDKSGNNLLDFGISKKKKTELFSYGLGCAMQKQESLSDLTTNLL